MGLPFVRVQTLDDGAALLDLVAANWCRDVVVVGGGYIGLEMAEAFERGARVLVDSSDHVMSTLDADMAGLVAEAITRFGVDLRTGVAVEGFEEGTVHTEAGELKADSWCSGSASSPTPSLPARPASTSAPRAPSLSTVGSGPAYDEGRRRLRRVVPSGLATADPHGAGDGGQPSGPGRRHQHRRWLRHLPRRGRHGGDEDLLHRDRPHRAERAGGDGRRIRRGGGNGREHDARRLLPGPARSRSSWWPSAAPAGCSAARSSARRAAGRIDVLAVAITSGMTVGEMINVDLSYAPPFSSVWDPVVAARRPRAPCRRPASLAVGVRSQPGAEPAEPPVAPSRQDLLRWSEALAGIACTGLGFTKNLYERERFRGGPGRGRRHPGRSRSDFDAAHVIDEWLGQVGDGVAAKRDAEGGDRRGGGQRRRRAAARPAGRPECGSIRPAGPTSATRRRRWR